jgi:dephospho-CoA kinase
MIIIGLTGSIGMGKSTAAALLRGLKVPVHEADKAVHKLLGPKGRAVKAVAEIFPTTLKKGEIDRRLLAQAVYGNKSALRKLEAVLHPLVQQETARWLKRQKALRRKLVVLDIPLLFEAKREAGCDAIWVVSAAAAIQRARVLARPGMTPSRLQAILRRQLPDTEKRRRADIVIPTGDGLALTKVHLQKALRRPMTAQAWTQYWTALT